jgi:hypothetical protein
MVAHPASGTACLLKTLDNGQSPKKEFLSLCVIYPKYVGI